MDWQDLDSLIDRFSGMVHDASPASIIPLPSTPNWKAVWEQAKEIHNGFRNVRYPTVQDRQAAWTRFQELRELASEWSQAQRDNRRRTSEQNRNEILSQIEYARPKYNMGFGNLQAEALKEYGRELSKAGRMLSDRKHDMLAEHKQECFSAIQKVREGLDIWWGELKKQRERKRQEWESKQSAWRERVRRNLEKNYDRHRQASSALERHRQRADDLRSKIADAWNPGWAETASGWLSELEDKIQDIEAHIGRIEVWIQEDEEKLRQS